MLGESIAMMERKLSGSEKKKKAKPDFLDKDKDGDKKEPMKKAIKDKKVAEGDNSPFNWQSKPKNDENGDYEKKSSTGGTTKKKGNVTTHTHNPDRFTDAPYDSAEKKSAEKKPSKAAKTSAEKAAAREKDIKLPAWKGNVTKHKSSHGEEKDDGTGDEVKESFKGDQAKLDKNKNGKLDSKDFAALRKGNKKNMKESQFKQHVKMVNESLRQLIAEDEEGKAKAITAGADMVNDFTSWMQRVGQYQTKSMIELADMIRANFGQQESEQFKSAVAPALEQALNTLTQCREEISQSVAVLAGEAPAMQPMGGDMSGGMPGDMAPGNEELSASPDEMNMPTDEFGASDAASGGSEIAGRVRRESRELFARKLNEAHSIVSILSK